MGTVISHSSQETEALGFDWAGNAKEGWVIGLIGDLGAGKTEFIKGFARGLGSRARVSSPTFTLVNIYDDGRLPLYHWTCIAWSRRKPSSGPVSKRISNRMGLPWSSGPIGGKDRHRRRIAAW